MIDRSDLSKKLIHFTRKPRSTAEKNFDAILNQKKLVSSKENPFISFTESPIGSFPAVFSNDDFPYAPLGVMVDKIWLYEKGGRPVLYQSESEAALLPAELKYKHKLYNPISGDDFTWEREWRIPVTELDIEPEQTTLIMPTRRWVEQKKDEWPGSSPIMVEVFGSPYFVSKIPWHFIALEDLGVNLPQEWR